MSNDNENPCDDVEVRSLDGRLVSRSKGSVITYPILLLGRDPVREDAKGWKEVLVFQDKATTLRVTPQPIVLCEENGYSASGLIESNGSWLLYSYDTAKLVCLLKSGASLTDGAGNDTLAIRKSNASLAYGVYDSTLLFLTDTADEPYLVPVVLDYAKPLRVKGDTGSWVEAPGVVNITIEENETEKELCISREKYWQIVGFPTTGELSLVAKDDAGDPDRGYNDRCIYIQKGVYSEITDTTFSFIVQSGIKQVQVRVTVEGDAIFEVSDGTVVFGANGNVVLNPNTSSDKDYQQTLYVKWYNYDDYTITEPAGYTCVRGAISPIDLDTVKGYFTSESRSEDQYEKIIIEYTGADIRTAQAGSNLSSTSQVVLTPVYTVSGTELKGPSRTIRCYRNIERTFEVKDDTIWSIFQDICGGAPSEIGTRAKNLNLAEDFTPTTTIQVKANQSVSVKSVATDPTGGYNVSSDGLTYSLSGAQDFRDLTFKSNSIWLDMAFTVTLTFPSYTRYVLSSINALNSQLVPAQEVDISFKVTYPHFIRARDVYLQWDNDWTQHNWVLTNPDAKVSVSNVGHDQSSSLSLVTATTSAVSSGERLLPLSVSGSSSYEYDIFTVNIQSKADASVATKTGTFKVLVCNSVSEGNEIVPKTASSGSSILGGFTISEGRLFDRDNWCSGERGSLLTIPSTSSVDATIRNEARYESRGTNNATRFNVIFDKVKIIRSWSYSVFGKENIACGFLIEGKSLITGQWETISAVTDFDTHSSSSSTVGPGGDDGKQTIVIDYVTVAPRPWKDIRIMITQARNASGGLFAPDATVSPEIKVGQFQFYESYPVLKRTTGATNYQLNVKSGNVQYIQQSTNTSYAVASVADGKLFSGAVEPIGAANWYWGSNEYWHYRLVESDAGAISKYSPGAACLGICLKAAIDVTGVRYDTGIVEGYSTAGAITVDTASSCVKQSDIDAAESYSAFTVISAWRHLGVGLRNVSSGSLATDSAAITDFAKKAQELVFGQAYTDPVADGTTVTLTDNQEDDYKLLRYSNGQWHDIGQDVIINTSVKIVNFDKLMPLSASGVSAPTADMSNIMSTWGKMGGRNYFAVTHPDNGHRLLYIDGVWYDTYSSIPEVGVAVGRDDFSAYRGRQFYRYATADGILSFRLSVAGLADTMYSWVHSNRIRAVMGEFQIFERFEGVNITFKDIQVNGKSINYGEAVFTQGASISIKCNELTVNGAPADSSTGNRLFAQTRQSTSIQWNSVAWNGTSFFTPETNFTVTSVTLFYQMGDAENKATDTSRMYPFFTFTVVRS